MGERRTSKTKGGYFNIPNLDNYAEEVAKELCKRYPDIDIWELDYLFCHKLSYSLAIESMIENKSARCRGCYCCIKDDNGNWICDHCGKNVETILDEDCLRI